MYIAHESASIYSQVSDDEMKRVTLDKKKLFIYFLRLILYLKSSLQYILPTYLLLFYLLYVNHGRVEIKVWI